MPEHYVNLAIIKAPEMGLYGFRVDNTNVANVPM